MESPATSLAVPAFGVAQGGLSLFSALQGNNAVQGAIDDAARAAEFEQATVSAQAGARLAENQARMAQVRGRVRIQSQNGEGGEALIRQVAIDAKKNEAAIRLNQSIQTTAIRRGYQAQASQFASQAINPILAALSGALSGGVTGLQIGGAFEDMTASRESLNQLRAGGLP